MRLTPNLMSLQNLKFLEQVMVERVEEQFPAQEVQSLTTVTPPDFTGVYALYYTGHLRCYQFISEANDPDRQIWKQPLYIGKAPPPGSRTGKTVESYSRHPMNRRLVEHRESLNQAENLRVEDFWVRCYNPGNLVISSVEELLITRYQPYWNTHLDGFGMHDPGTERYDGDRPRWDTLHPGREWAPHMAEPPYTQRGLARRTYRNLYQQRAQKELSRERTLEDSELVRAANECEMQADPGLDHRTAQEEMDL